MILVQDRCVFEQAIWLPFWSESLRTRFVNDILFSLRVHYSPNIILIIISSWFRSECWHIITVKTWRGLQSLGRKFATFSPWMRKIANGEVAKYDGGGDDHRFRDCYGFSCAQWAAHVPIYGFDNLCERERWMVKKHNSSSGEVSYEDIFYEEYCLWEVKWACPVACKVCKPKKTEAQKT